MSHFTTLAIIPKEVYNEFETKEDVEILDNYICNLMDPFCEHNEVEPYAKPCWRCKGTKFIVAPYNEELNGKPCDEEDECDENGECMSTYNPDSQWDWYVIGGRWDGDLNDLHKPRSMFGTPAEDSNSFKDNSAKISQILERDDVYTPFSFVTPEGEWIEKGDMGWWACVIDEKSDDDWIKECGTIYNKYKEDYVVLLDCHI